MKKFPYIPGVSWQNRTHSSLWTMTLLLLMILSFGSLTSCRSAQTISGSHSTSSSDSSQAFPSESYAPPDESSSEADPDLPVPDSGPTSVFQAVLRGEQTFFETGIQEELNMRTIGRAITPDDIPFRATRFALADLDQDSRNEVVLEIASETGAGMGGFVILREQGGSVHGYTLWYRAFNDLKADGTFSFSSSAFSSGFGRLSFQEDGYIVHELALSDIHPDNPEQLLYYLEGSAVSETAFCDAILRQARKLEPIWHDFTETNLNNLADLI